VATGTGKWYSKFFQTALNKEVNLVTATIDTLAITLHTSAYDFTNGQDTHDYQNDATSELGTATGYTAGGKTLSSVTWAYSAGANLWILDAADVTWSSSTITARYAVIADTSNGNSTTNPLIACIDFGTDVVSQGGDFSITFDVNGIAKLTVS